MCCATGTEMDCVMKPLPYSPFKRFGIAPVGGRSTVVRLANNDLWVLASSKLDTPTKAKLDELGGRVKYIVGPDAVHSLYLCAWAACNAMRRQNMLNTQ